MASVRFSDASQIPLVGGSPCLDFVNTTGLRSSGAPRERLISYGEFLCWWDRCGIGEAGRHTALACAAEGSTSDARRALRQICEARECFYRVMLASLAGDPPRAQDLHLVQTLYARAARRRAVILVENRLALEWPAGDELLSPLWPIVHDAVGLLTSASERLRQCGECDWLFLDGSTNASRRWCKKTCGDRVKARRYYARQDRNGPKQPR